jgi:Alpha-2-macroglobulin family
VYISVVCSSMWCVFSCLSAPVPWLVGGGGSLVGCFLFLFCFFFFFFFLSRLFCFFFFFFFFLSLFVSLFLLLISLFLHRLTCLSESTLVSITVCLPLMLQGRAPRFLNMGDRSQLPVAVYNRSPSKLRVSLAARCANARLLTTGMKVEIAPNSREGVCVVISPSCLPPAKNSLSLLCVWHICFFLYGLVVVVSLSSLSSLSLFLCHILTIYCVCAWCMCIVNENLVAFCLCDFDCVVCASI